MPGRDERLGAIGQMGRGEPVWESDEAMAFLFNTQWSGGLAGERTFPWRPVGFGEPTLGYLQRSGSGDREEHCKCSAKGGWGPGPGQVLWGPLHTLSPASLSLAPRPGPHWTVILLQTSLLRERRGKCGHPFPPPLTPELQG